MYTKVITRQKNNYYSLELCSDLKTKDMVNKLSSLNLTKVELLFWFFPHLCLLLLPIATMCLLLLHI